MRNTLQHSGAVPRVLVLIVIAALLLISAGTGELSATTPVDTTAITTWFTTAAPVTAVPMPEVLTTTTTAQ